jgi:hypothetical protein
MGPCAAGSRSTRFGATTSTLRQSLQNPVTAIDGT